MFSYCNPVGGTFYLGVFTTDGYTIKNCGSYLTAVFLYVLCCILFFTVTDDSLDIQQITECIRRHAQERKMSKRPKAA